MGRSLLAFAVVVPAWLVACAAGETMPCPPPEPLPAPELPADPSACERPPAPAQAEAEAQECEPKRREDWTRATHEDSSLMITARVYEDPDRPDNEGWPQGFIEIEVAHLREGLIETLEYPAEFGGCNVEAIETWVEPIYADGELSAFEVRYRCVLGAEIVRVRTQHLIVATYVADEGVGLVWQGESYTVGNHGLGVEVDKREFYVELDTLAVYRHTVAYCDSEGLRELTGHSGSCKTQARKLRLVERVPISVPAASEAE